MTHSMHLGNVVKQCFQSKMHMHMVVHNTHNSLKEDRCDTLTDCSELAHGHPCSQSPVPGGRGEGKGEHITIKQEYEDSYSCIGSPQ